MSKFTIIKIYKLIFDTNCQIYRKINPASNYQNFKNKVGLKESSEVYFLLFDRERSTRNGGSIYLQGLGSRALENLSSSSKNGVVTGTSKSVIGK